MITGIMKKINNMKRAIFSAFLVIPFILIWATILADNFGQNNEKTDITVDNSNVQGGNNSGNVAGDNKVIREEVCPTQEENEYLFVGCNGFF
jgi:hypothetical protein